MSSEPVSVKINDKDFTCGVCGGGKFIQKKGRLLPDNKMTFIKNIESAACLVCIGCGYVHWFMPQYKTVTE